MKSFDGERCQQGKIVCSTLFHNIVYIITENRSLYKRKTAFCSCSQVDLFFIGAVGGQQQLVKNAFYNIFVFHDLISFRAQ